MKSGDRHELAILSAAGVAHLTALATIFEALAGEGEGSTVRLRLLPMGRFAPRDARIAHFSIADAAEAQKVVDASRQFAGQQQIPVDYDHQLQFGAKDGVGGTAPAAGWIDPASLSVEADGIYGNVTWTPRARDAIRAQEYRYMSPVIRHEKSGRVLRLDSVGLTNLPAVDGLDRLAASLNPTKETEMDLSALAISLGLPATATLAEIETAQKAQAAALSTAQASVAALNQALGLQGDADQTTALAAVTTLKSSGDTSAQTALMTQMQSELTTLREERIQRVVGDHIAAGRVAPAQKEHFLALMRKDEKSALAIMGAAPAVLTPGAQVSGKPAGEITALSVEQQKVADMLGIKHDDYLASLKESAA